MNEAPNGCAGAKYRGSSLRSDDVLAWELEAIAGAGFDAAAVVGGEGNAKQG